MIWWCLDLDLLCWVSNRCRLLLMCLWLRVFMLGFLICSWLECSRLLCCWWICWGWFCRYCLGLMRFMLVFLRICCRLVLWVCCILLVWLFGCLDFLLCWCWFWVLLMLMGLFLIEFLLVWFKWFMMFFWLIWLWL